MTNGFNIDRYQALEGMIIEPVPEDVRLNYKFWRAAHLGKIALNVMRGRPTLNAWSEPVSAHFTSQYPVALNIAEALSQPNLFRKSQFNEQDAADFERLTGLGQTFAHPSMVLALQRQHEFDLELSEAAGGGHYLPLALTIDKLDPYSQAALADIFGRQNFQA